MRLDPSRTITVSKYEALRRIESCGLPHPDWRFVGKSADIPEKPWSQAPHGWTIRCCPRTTYEFGLPSRHRLVYGELLSTLELLGKIAAVSEFVIYPSWEFLLSGCLMISDDGVTVEVVRGDIAPLLAGEKTPESRYVSEVPFHRLTVACGGGPDLLSQDDKSILVQAVDLLQAEALTVLEWTKTTEGLLVFHDLQESSKR